jgi:FtsP/CotA-like multicopper oxidase with cupredoxin domain
VDGLPERFLVVRDQPLQNPPQNPRLAPTAPYWDVSLNYVPIPYPTYPPGVIQMQSGAQEFWRVVNAAADTNLDLQLLFDGQAQPLQIVALDGVPTGSQDGHHQGTIITQTDVYIPPASRAEFIVTGPTASVKNAVLMTNHIDTGPAGDVDTRRPLAQIQLTTDARKIPQRVHPAPGKLTGDRFANLDESQVTAHRAIFFDESVGTEKRKPGGGGLFFVTVKGQQNVAFYSGMPPAITTTQGAVEEWTIANHTHEVHEFHIHQIHFLVVAVNGVKIPPKQRQWRDTYQVPYWTGKGKYPSITALMDFRGDVVGDFVFHCHILDHEDGGMMQIIRVLPPGGTTQHARAQDPQRGEAKLIKVGASGTPPHA